MFSTHPAFLLASFVSAWLYSLVLRGRKALRQNCLIFAPAILLMTFFNTLNVHNGVTVLFYLNGNRITAEAIVFGCVSAILLSSVIVWFRCFSAVVTADKFIYLFGRFAPVLALTLSMILRDIPLLKARFQEISSAQRCMSCSLSQKFSPSTRSIHRFLVGYDVTDEIFGISIARPGPLDPYYVYGAIVLAAPGWAVGTYLGVMIRPCYYKGERGNKPYEIELMLRLYLLQNLYSLSDEATITETIDSRAFSDFCGISSSNQVPDGDTLGRFRNILIHNNLQEKLFAQVVELLQQRGLLLKKGTIVDSTMIAAPSSTKNQEKQRDPEAHQVKKGNAWHFGYKAHVGVDKDSGLVHTVEVTAANVHGIHILLQRVNLPPQLYRVLLVDVGRELSLLHPGKMGDPTKVVQHYLLQIHFTKLVGRAGTLAALPIGGASEVVLILPHLFRAAEHQVLAAVGTVYEAREQIGFLHDLPTFGAPARRWRPCGSRPSIIYRMGGSRAAISVAPSTVFNFFGILQPSFLSWTGCWTPP